MTTSSTDRPTHPAHAGPQPSATGGRAWAVSGVVGALVAFVTLFFLSVELTNVDESLLGDNARLVQAIQGDKTIVWIVQAGTSLAALLVLVFGAGLRRRLAQDEPDGSLLPLLAFAGMLLVAAMLLVGGGISTELYHGLRRYADADPDTIAANLAIYNTMAWLWAGAGLSAGAVAVAGFRRRVVGRGLAVFSAAMAALIALTQLFPVQYIALVPGVLWVVVAGAAFALGKRR
ncbi:hypothetical protein SAMN04489712_10932 [Thermomonospora echinospora]|uniref:DUF4386 domain-containing protein n=1 Tax=Thermomonospora echinospora TaxID=1992 RepID=A0A1H6C7I4_9ACTN|nr:hypothetical protein [Thermomonospora echinospora]SEG68924.1 hypothetical protein SAMN04489712_10932 [Thermomonospora echinospora]